jgi:hypothetical protein
MIRIVMFDFAEKEICLWDGIYFTVNLDEKFRHSDYFNRLNSCNKKIVLNLISFVNCI